MAVISLIYVQNTISRAKRAPCQQLTFLLRVENISYDKQVDILWSDESGEEYQLTAAFIQTQTDGAEQWQAQTEWTLSPVQSLPGNIQFRLSAMIGDVLYIDDNQGFQYQSQADSGLQLAPSLSFWNHQFNPVLNESQENLDLTLMVSSLLQSEQVMLYWSTDNWQTVQQHACEKAIDYWHRTTSSNARNPNQYGTELWTASLPLEQAFRVEYCICCETDAGKHWFNNEGQNYQSTRQPLKVMILNLHCYQEELQDEKFSTIARAIEEQNVDVVCFQEVAENWNDGNGDWSSNSANIINQLLEQPFNLYADWSHLGFDRYREGVAILSRFPLQANDSRYVSNSDDAYDIHARKVVRGQIDVPFYGQLHLFSAHLSWWEDGFQEQFTQLHDWAQSLSSGSNAVLLCGDFNVAVGSTGYQLVVDKYGYQDQFLLANQQGLTDRGYRVEDAHWHQLDANDYRIDFIFQPAGGQLRAVAAQPLFTDQDYGRVSDHCGYVMTFEPTG